MTSSVFFRFKSSKEPTRVAFDGTGISVFELKREIITMNKLGDGTDFDLIISTEDTNEVYDDDTTIIPRSTTVIAQRKPPKGGPGRGGAARYISGKMPQNAKNSHRQEAVATKPSAATTSGLSNMTGAQTEEEKIAAFMQMGADQWAQQKQEMANATPIHRGGPHRGGKPLNLPEGTPPDGYLCYRCGEKGHWIQACPTNGDPSYDDRKRIKRTTGIPKSMLRTVEKPVILANDGTLDDTKQPTGVMVNAEGEWVVAEPDKAAWDRYQAKAKVSAAAQEAAAKGSKELQDRGIECAIDKRLFVDPTKTPCCEKTFCHDCITNSLLENDLRCPECSTENILLDDLKLDEEMVAKIRAYDEEKAAEQVKKEGSESPAAFKEERPEDNKSPLPIDVPKSPSKSPNSKSLKRKADNTLENNRSTPNPPEFKPQASTITSKPSPSPAPKPTPIPTGPASQQKQQSQQNHISTLNNFLMPGMSGMPNMDPMAFQNLMAMSMGPMMAINPAITNPMMMPSFGGNMPNMNANGWNGNMGNMHGFNSMPLNNGFQPNMMPDGNNFNPYNNMNASMNGMNNGMLNHNQNNNSNMGFANQQRTQFGGQGSGNEDDGAYFRKPVNPHRHQGRRNLPRPTDYREI